MLALLAGRDARRRVGPDAARRRAASAPRTRRTAVRFRAARRAAASTTTSRAASGAAAPAAYAIQEAGAALVSSIDGCFFNVVGLPVALLVEMLGERRRPVSG